MNRWAKLRQTCWVHLVCFNSSHKGRGELVELKLAAEAFFCEHTTMSWRWCKKAFSILSRHWLFVYFFQRSLWKLRILTRSVETRERPNLPNGQNWSSGMTNKAKQIVRANLAWSLCFYWVLQFSLWSEGFYFIICCIYLCFFFLRKTETQIFSLKSG